jgi:formylglycine-generating enzyme required for sulfatase activity
MRICRFRLKGTGNSMASTRLRMGLVLCAIRPFLLDVVASGLGGRLRRVVGWVLSQAPMTVLLLSCGGCAFNHQVNQIEMTGAPSRDLVLGLGDAFEMRFVWVPASPKCPMTNAPFVTNSQRVVAEANTNGFWLGKYEVTQAQWRSLMSNNPSYWPGQRRPVERVTMREVQTFLNRMGDLFIATGLQFRLPREGEWEHACRAGTQTEYFFGNAPEGAESFAWFRDNSNGASHDVGTKRPNPWGLHDICGNVLELVGSLDDGHWSRAVGDGERTVLPALTAKGGAWGLHVENCRWRAYVKMQPGSECNWLVGFRVLGEPRVR